MAFVKDNNNNEDMAVYLTEFGRQKMLDQGFVPSQFSISDSEADYLANNSVSTHITDLTGDYDDNVYSMSENVSLKIKIIL